jgi:hypothetical protein
MFTYFYHPYINDINLETHVSQSALDHWVLETYKNFRTYNINNDLAIGKSIPSEGIIFFHSKYFPENLRPNQNQYFVSFQVDVGRYKYAQCHIVHNPYQVNAFKFPGLLVDKLLSYCHTYYIDPWPIKNILRRNIARYDSVLNLSFHGNMINTPKEIRSDNFMQFLKERNMNLNFYFRPEQWNDFSETDLSLCIRSFSKNKFYAKPFLKITNSLLANVPVITGIESSSVYFQKFIMDIPLVNNYDSLLELIDAISQNKHNPYDQISNFKKIENRFSEIGVADQWKNLLKFIVKDFDLWRKIGRSERALFYFFRSAKKIV